MKRAVIRVDSSFEIGTGHVMRCLTLAEELREHKFNVTFVKRNLEGNISSLIKEKGYELKLLKKPKMNNAKGKIRENLQHSNWLGVTQEEDAFETYAFIKNKYKTIDLLIVDHYGIDYRWESSFKSITKNIFVIDDLADRKHTCDYLLDQNLYSNMEKRYLHLVGEKCKLLLGPRYALLRKEFKESRRLCRVREKVERIMIFFGGSDPTNETEKTLRAIQMLGRKDIILDVVVGLSNKRIQEIEKLVKQLKGNFHLQINNMASLMQKADLTIGAGGSTTWERCYLGLPAITIEVAINQSELLEKLATMDVIKHLGSSEKVTKHNIALSINELIVKTDLLKKMSRNAFYLINNNISILEVFNNAD